MVTNILFIISVYRFVGHKVGSLYVKLSISPCGGYLASGSSDGFAYIWSTNSTISVTKALKPKQNATATTSAKAAEPQASQFTPLAKLHGHDKEVTSVDWSCDPDNITVCFILSLFLLLLNFYSYNIGSQHHHKSNS